MLYHAIELHKALLTPAVELASATSSLLLHPRNPLGHTVVGRTIAANHELFARIHRRYPKPVFGIDAIGEGELRRAVREEVVAIRVASTDCSVPAQFGQDAR